MYNFKLYQNHQKHLSNTTNGSPGGFCNQLIRNICSSEIAKKYNLKFTYNYHNECLYLGIPLYTEGQLQYYSYKIFGDADFENYITNNYDLKQNIIVNQHYFQTPFNAHYVRNYLLRDDIKPGIIQNNKFKERYDNNRDLFIHVRLGDAAKFNPGFTYYDNMIQNKIPEYDMAYISSDEMSHPICQQLINKYNMKEIVDNPIETIMYGSTCKYILLSAGTFSWIIGVLGFNSTIFCPNLEYENTEKWHGNLFIFDNWIK